MKNDMNKKFEEIMKKVQDMANENLKTLTTSMKKFDPKNISMKDVQSGMNSLIKWTSDFVNSQQNMDKGGPGRPMKYPYTFSAKIAQFPLRFYVQNQWIWKYYAASFVVCIPVFYSLHKMSNSPGNVAQWAEIRRKEAAEHHH